MRHTGPCDKSMFNAMQGLEELLAADTHTHTVCDCPPPRPSKPTFYFASLHTGKHSLQKIFSLALCNPTQKTLQKTLQKPYKNPPKTLQKTLGIFADQRPTLSGGPLSRPSGLTHLGSAGLAAPLLPQPGALTLLQSLSASGLTRRLPGACVCIGGRGCLICVFASGFDWALNPIGMYCTVCIMHLSIYHIHTFVYDTEETSACCSRITPHTRFYSSRRGSRRAAGPLHITPVAAD
jgi:hypothetical protein